mmetsp:Transcript_13592/g.37741  ORF Transcript_13592/g.37741 Transcript_13592/m.37741 type:complete len:285 (+) Transcript_13592:2-856(+)
MRSPPNPIQMLLPDALASKPHPASCSTERWNVLVARMVPQRHVVGVRHVRTDVPRVRLADASGLHGESFDVLLFDVPGHEVVHRHVHGQHLDEGLGCNRPDHIPNCCPEVAWLHDGLANALPRATVFACKPKCADITWNFLQGLVQSGRELREDHSVVLENDQRPVARRALSPRLEVRSAAAALPSGHGYRLGAIPVEQLCHAQSAVLLAHVLRWRWVGTTVYRIEALHLQPRRVLGSALLHANPPVFAIFEVDHNGLETSKRCRWLHVFSGDRLPCFPGLGWA